MTIQTIFYPSSILLTCVLTGFLAWYAWKHRQVPGSSAYAWLALSECLLALTEILSVFSPSMTSALSWFQARYPIGAFIAVFWLVFALEYSGHREWLSKRLLAGIFVIPLVTQILFWSNSLHSLWMKQEAAFYQIGRLWIADISSRIPGLGYLTHSFYNLFLTLAGIALMLLTAWRMRRALAGQALMLAGAGLTALFFVLNSIFGLLPKTEFNIFTPGIGLSVLLIALAVFRFDFLKHAPAQGNDVKMTRLDAHEKYSLAGFILTFILFASAFASVSYITYQNYEEQFRAQVKNELSAIASLKADELQDWWDEHLAHASLFYHNENFSEWVRNYLEDPQDAEAQAKLLTWMEKIKAFPEYDRVFLLDIQGLERLSLPADPEAVPTELVEQVSASLASGQVVFLDFHRHSESDAVHLSMLVPIYDAQDNQPLGVLVLRIDPNVYLYPFIQRWPVPSASAETLLLRREEKEALYLNQLRYQPDAALNLRFPLTENQITAVRAALGETGFVDGLDYRGVEVIADIRAVPDSPWFLVSKIDRAEIYAPLRARLWQTILFFGAWVFAAGAGLLLSWRQQRARFYRRQIEAAEAVRASEEKFRLAFETSPDSVAITRVKDGMFVSVNKGFEQITGYTREQVIGKTSLEINIWKDPEDRRKIVEGLKTRGEVRDYEAPFLTRDGEIVGLMSAVIIELNGEPHILNIVRDITERKQAEAALRESEDKFKHVFDYSVIGKSITLPSGEINANKAFCEMLGYSQEEIKGGKWQEISHPDDMELTQKAINSLLSGEKESARFIKRYIHKNGSTVWADVGSALRRDKDGKPLYFITTVSDITERKLAEEALLQRENLLNKIFDVLPVGIWLADKNGQLTRSNEKGRGIWGAEPLVGQEQYGVFKARRLPSGEELAPEDWALAHTIKEGVTVLDEMLEIDSFDGKKKVILNFTAPVFDAAGNVEAAVIINLDITERKQMENALRESEEEYRSLVQSIQVGVVVHAPDSSVLFSNPKASQLLGLPPDQMRGKLAIDQAWRFIREDETQMPLEEYPVNQALASNKPITNLLLGILRPDRERPTWVQCNAHQDWDLDGNLQQVVVSFADITERKQAEDALRESEARLRAIFDATPFPIALVDFEDNEIYFWSHSAVTLFGHTASTTAEWYEIAYPDPDYRREVIERWKPALEKARLTAKEVNTGEYRIACRDGSVRICELYAAFLGRKLIVTFNDITERKQAEEEMRKSQEQFRIAQDMSPDGFTILQPVRDAHKHVVDFTWVYENAAVARLNGTDPEAVVGKRLLDLFPGHRGTPILRAYQQVAESGEACIFESNYSGESMSKPTSFRIVVVPMAGNIAILAQDITERKQIEEALQEYNTRLEADVDERTRELREAHEQLVRQERLAALGQLAGSIGHELRNPLGVISNAVYFLKMSQPNASDKVREYLNMIEIETRASDKIITDLLDFTRIKSLDRQPVSVSELLRQTLERRAIPSSIETALQIPADLPKIYADPQHVIQVLGNLISNACQSMTDGVTNGRKLTVSAAVESAMIKIDIQDMGVGIPPENMKKIFEPLFTTKIKGIGLGLAVSRKLLEANGGRIEVESELGKGSTFTVYLPVYENR